MASVPLAEILGLADDDGRRIELLDVYVPPPVDFSITVKIEQGASSTGGRRRRKRRRSTPESPEERMAAMTDAAELAELQHRQRNWPALRSTSRACSRLSI